MWTDCQLSFLLLFDFQNFWYDELSVIYWFYLFPNSNNDESVWFTMIYVQLFIHSICVNPVRIKAQNIGHANKMLTFFIVCLLTRNNLCFGSILFILSFVQNQTKQKKKEKKQNTSLLATEHESRKKLWYQLKEY